MTEPTPDTAPDTAAQPDAETKPEAAEADSTDWKAEARKWEQRAKENKAAAAELEKARKASMTEAERAVVEAEARGRTAAMTEFGQRLVRSDFVAAAARRNPEYDAASVLDDLNLARFLTEDGEPDGDAIAKAVERLVPTSNGPKFGNADQGPRGGGPVADFNAQLRRAAGRT